MHIKLKEMELRYHRTLNKKPYVILEFLLFQLLKGGQKQHKARIRKQCPWTAIFFFLAVIFSLLEREEKASVPTKSPGRQST